MTDIREIKQGQKDWVKTINDNSKHGIVVLQDWTTNGIVLKNGFANVSNDMGTMLQWRRIGSLDGSLKFTEIFGAVTVKNYAGQEIEFAEIPGELATSRLVPIGSVLRAGAGGITTGYGWVTVISNGASTKLYMSGHPNGDHLDGWLSFHILY